MSVVNYIAAFGPLEETHQDFEQFVSSVERLFEHSMDPDLLDDRLNRQWRSEIVGHDSYRAVLCSNESGEPIGLLEHWTTETGNVRLEIVLDRRFTEAAVEPPASATLSDGVALVEMLFVALCETIAESGVSLLNKPNPVEIWARPTSAPIERWLVKRDATLTRHLFQMRTTPEPAQPDFVDQSVAFSMDDRDDLIKINNQAFVDHPDQGDMTIERFDRIMSEPWFRLDGIRLWKVEGKVAAFCWTKIHTKPAIGEIYVVGVDPSSQGQGLGKLVTAAGVHWLQSQQQERVMLYVEANNIPAVAVYERLGFSTVRVDKAWHLPAPDGSSDINRSSESLT